MYSLSKIVSFRYNKLPKQLTRQRQSISLHQLGVDAGTSSTNAVKINLRTDTSMHSSSRTAQNSTRTWRSHLNKRL